MRSDDVVEPAIALFVGADDAHLALLAGAGFGKLIADLRFELFAHLRRFTDADFDVCFGTGFDLGQDLRGDLLSHVRHFPGQLKFVLKDRH